MFKIFSWLYVTSSCFKQPPTDTKYILLLSYPGVGARLLSGGLITSSDNPLDFHSEILLVLLIFFKDICALAEILNNFAHHLFQNKFY